MVEMIREIGIFIVIAQAVLYFVPGETYSKYVKVIIGILMITKMLQPVLVFISGEGWEKILEQPADLMEIQGFEEEFKTRGSEESILQAIGEELKMRLNEEPADGYIVESVTVKEGLSKETEKITIAVSKTETRNENEIKIDEIKIQKMTADMSDTVKKEKERLKEYYGNLLAVPSGQIEIAGL